jgi:hypothetical protein
MPMQETKAIKQVIVHRLETSNTTVEMEQLGNGSVHIRINEHYDDGQLEADRFSEAWLAPEFVKEMADLWGKFKEMVV